MLWDYLKALIHYWVVLLTGTVLAVIGGWGPILAGRQPHPVVALVILSLAVAVAGFFPWRDERRRTVKASEKRAETYRLLDELLTTAKGLVELRDLGSPSLKEMMRPGSFS